jgi:hypothetical protein
MGNLELGKTLSYVGGVLSLIAGFVIIIYIFVFGDIFAGFGDYFPINGITGILIFVLIITVGGGITTLVGASRIDEYGPDKAATIIIVGSIIGGTNRIALIGGILVKQANASSGFLAGNQYRGVVPNQSYYPQNTSQSSQKRFCKNCGAPIGADARFCQTCGLEK